MDLALEHHDVLTNGVRLHVVQCGPAAGPLVILLHGFPEYWETWREQLPALVAAGYRVWVPDQRGYHLSDKPRGIRAYTLPVLAADVLGLLAAARHQQAHVIGHDWGAVVAWYLAAQHPERLLSTTSINVPHPAALGLRTLRRVPSQPLRSWYILFFQLPWLPEQVFRRRNWTFGRRMLVGSTRPGTFGPAEVARYVAAWAQPGALTAMINWYRALRYGGRQSWPRIKGPLQIVWGKQDIFLQAQLAELSLRQCDQGQLHYFPYATHWVHLEEPGAVNELLLKFMAAHPAGS